MNEPRVVESVTNECQSLGRAHESSSARAEQLIACLEGEIAKRDAKYQREVYGLNNEGDPIGGDPAGGYANDNARLRAELAAIKAQEPVAWPDDKLIELAFTNFGGKWNGDLWTIEDANLHPFVRSFAAPVSEAKAQGVVMPEREKETVAYGHDMGGNYEEGHADGWNACLDEVARLAAAPAAPAADAGHVFYGMDGNHP